MGLVSVLCSSPPSADGGFVLWDGFPVCVFCFDRCLSFVLRRAVWKENGMLSGN
jgi:hypothetical protein